MVFEKTHLLYENPLAGPEDIREFRAEGNVATTFPRSRLRMETPCDRLGAPCPPVNFVFWCPRDFPDHIAASWDFRPLTDAGLAMFWVAARGRHGEDLFDPSLAPRQGQYRQYHSGDINALHVSYYRRNPSEIGFRVCNLRKSHGFHLVCQGGDPLPDAGHARESYRIEVLKSGPHLRFSMDGVMLFHWTDDGSVGPVLEGGKIGFRQMMGLIAEYANLTVHAVEPRTA